MSRRPRLRPPTDLPAVVRACWRLAQQRSQATGERLEHELDAGPGGLATILKDEAHRRPANARFVRETGQATGAYTAAEVAAESGVAATEAEALFKATLSSSEPLGDPGRT